MFNSTPFDAGGFDAVPSASGSSGLSVRLLIACGGTRTPPIYAGSSTLTVLVSASGVGSLSSPAPAFEEDLVSYMGGFGLQLYPGHVPQGTTLPAVTYFLIGEEPFYAMRSAAGLTARVYQLSFFATVASQARSMEKVARSALHGYRGPMGSHRVSSCRLQNMMDLPCEPNADGSDDGIYHRIAEYRIVFAETVPVFL